MVKSTIPNRLTELYSFSEKFFAINRKEIIKSKEIYGKGASIELKKYYYNLLKTGKFYEYVIYFYIERVMPIIRYIQKGIKILDAGCGLGTESILFGLLDAKVTGLDIAENRLEVAKQRVRYFENQFNHKINVDFIHESIFEHHDKFDIIWVNEAISHINPVNEFLELCYSNLKPNGKIIIADANKLNPYIYLQSKKDQILSGGIYKKVKIGGLKEDQEISYAVERVFTIPSIKKILSQYFRVQSVINLRLLPFSLFRVNPSIMNKVEKDILGKMPILNQFSGTYVITSVKKDKMSI
jgi:2-polyprenyl-3-methyl-5-hydroxy-6-metoxy-1,4-benzoquinol methylase